MYRLESRFIVPVTTRDQTVGTTRDQTVVATRDLTVGTTPRDQTAVTTRDQTVGTARNRAEPGFLRLEGSEQRQNQTGRK